MGDRHYGPGEPSMGWVVVVVLAALGLSLVLSQRGEQAFLYPDAVVEINCGWKKYKAYRTVLNKGYVEPRYFEYETGNRLLLPDACVLEEMDTFPKPVGGEASLTPEQRDILTVIDKEEKRWVNKTM